MKQATERAATRLGSSIKIRPCFVQGVFSNRNGTRVDLPAPVGASRMAPWLSVRADNNESITLSTGNDCSMIFTVCNLT